MDLRQHILERAKFEKGRFISLPFFLDTGGMRRRQCTREAKIAPVKAEIRKRLGVSKGHHATRFRVEQWIGISSDEMPRMAQARDKWITNRWPLIEARMSRGDCYAWLDRHGYPTPPKSSCIGCPFHSDRFWRDMQINDPDSFADAVAADAALRQNGPVKGLRGQEYMHRSCQPLGDIDFEARTGGPQIDFMAECSGTCGT